MKDPKKTAEILRGIAKVLEGSPEEQAEFAEQAEEIARRKIENGLHTLVDKLFGKRPK